MPPPHTRSRLMCAPRAWSTRCARRSRVIRVRKWSSGIQLAPLTKIGSSLTTTVNGGPPQRHVRNLDRDRRVVVLHRHGRVHVADSHGQREVVAGPRVFDAGVYLDPAGTIVRDRREWTDLGEACDGPTFEAYRLPEARGLQVRSPVPAEAARHLADHVKRM